MSIPRRREVMGDFLNTNPHEYTRIFFLNTNTHEYTRMNTNIFLNTNPHEYTRMNTNAFFEHELPEITHEFFKNYL